MYRKIVIWAIILAGAIAAFIFREDIIKAGNQNSNVRISIKNPFEDSSSEFHALKIQKSEGGNKYEREFISKYNDVINYMVKIEKDVRERGDLSPEETYELYRYGGIMYDYFEENQSQISFGLLEKIMQKIGMVESLSHSYDVGVEVWHQSPIEEAPLILNSSNVSVQKPEPPVSQHELSPDKKLIIDGKYTMTSEEFYGKRKSDITAAPEVWIVRCPVCKELYNEEGWYALTEEEMDIRDIHVRHEEEEFVRKYFDADALKDYLEGGVDPWVKDEGFYEFLENHYVWYVTQYNRNTGKHERVKMTGMNMESSWDSISEVEDCWIAYLDWKKKNENRPIVRSQEGTGAVANGTNYELTGRTIEGSLPIPDFSGNIQGRVVIEIVVADNGEVISATFRAPGSTTNDSKLVSAAITAAKRAKFNPIPDKLNQKGTITYNFRLM